MYSDLPVTFWIALEQVISLGPYMDDELWGLYYEISEQV